MYSQEKLTYAYHHYFRKSYKKIIAVFVLIIFTTIAIAQSDQSIAPQAAPQAMTQQRMAEIIEDFADQYNDDFGAIQFTYNDVELALISDNRANRMRIVAPIIEVNELSEDMIIATLVSNYHLALDARYAIGDGLMYAAYMHPMRELTRNQLESAIRQVASLHNTFGTSFSSGELSFGVGNPELEEI